MSSVMNNETAALLEKHFDTAFDSPNGIKKLRELILTLAMQSKLVPQDPIDRPASELLKAIETEKKKLVKEGKIKKPKPLPEIKHDEIPYDLPKGWHWVRLRTICHDWGQKTPDSLFTYIDVGSIDNKRGVISNDVQLLESVDAPSRARKIVRKGTVIYSTVRPYLLNIAIVDKDFNPEPIASTAFAILHPFCEISNQFIYYYLRSPIFIDYVESTMKGVAYPAINDGDFFQGCFPLPPIAEQHRIVAEIDRLMARCDELEKLRTDRTQKRTIVHTAAIDRLLTAKDDRDFSNAWSFITQHFSELYSVKENVIELRKVILQLAVMGKLVPQDPNDEPASELLKAIEAEKQRLVEAGKIKDTKISSFIDPIDISSKIPDIWKWVRIENICEVIVDCPHSTPKFISDGVICLDTNSFKSGNINQQKLRYVSEETYLDRISRLSPQVDDVIFAREGSVGESVIVPKEMRCCLGQRVMLFRPAKEIFSRYLQLSISNPLFLTKLLSVYKGIGAKHVNVKDMRNALVPLPPTAEQRRIVEKIDRLMEFCDRLEETIEATKIKQTDLLNAVMSRV